MNLTVYGRLDGQVEMKLRPSPGDDGSPLDLDMSAADAITLGGQLIEKGQAVQAAPPPSSPLKVFTYDPRMTP